MAAVLTRLASPCASTSRRLPTSQSVCNSLHAGMPLHAPIATMTKQGHACGLRLARRCCPAAADAPLLRPASLLRPAVEPRLPHRLRLASSLLKKHSQTQWVACGPRPGTAGRPTTCVVMWLRMSGLRGVLSGEVVETRIAWCSDRVSMPAEARRDHSSDLRSRSPQRRFQISLHALAAPARCTTASWDRTRMPGCWNLAISG